jgi:uncharacterized membrane protein
MQDSQDQQYGVSRLIAFSDGVFGFAITLLVTSIPTLNLPMPKDNAAVWSNLIGLFPSFYSYAFSFLMVGVYWIAHHRTFRHIIKYDSTLLWMNLVLLLFIAFLPFPTSLLGRYSNSSVITAFYAAILSTISLLYVLQERYAFARHRLVTEELDDKTMTISSLRGTIPFIFFLLSIGLAFISPMLARYLWLAIFLVRPVVIRLYTRNSEQQT